MAPSASQLKALTAINTLANFCANLSFNTLDNGTLNTAKACLIDAIGCAIHGSKMPWSKIILSMVEQDGPCKLPGITGIGYSIRDAALAYGACAHAFELDNLRKPGAGVHPGATVAIPALMMAQTVNANFGELLRAITIGCEVQFRIGAATLHTPEKIGFHAPGITGPFGAAAACGALLNFNALQFANAFGICGSMAAGLLAFAKTDQGGMVKRLHLGRAAESGVTATLLAHQGFEGPHSALEGKFGVLESYAESFDARLLTKDLGVDFETKRICFKSFACHITAHAPVQLLQMLLTQHGYDGAAIKEITIYGSEKMISHHNIQEPSDPLMAQYSIPYAVASAAFNDPFDPDTFGAIETHGDAVRQLSRNTTVKLRSISNKPSTGWGVEMRIKFHDGFIANGELDIFDGCPEKPLSHEAFKHKFSNMTRHLGSANSSELFKRLNQLDMDEKISMFFG